MPPCRIAGSSPVGRNPEAAAPSPRPPLVSDVSMEPRTPIRTEPPHEPRVEPRNTTPSAPPQPQGRRLKPLGRARKAVLTLQKRLANMQSSPEAAPQEVVLWVWETS